MLKAALALHVIAGTTALVSMWIPMFAKKGASLHRTAGKVFVAAMAGCGWPPRLAPCGSIPAISPEPITRPEWRSARFWLTGYFAIPWT